MLVHIHRREDVLRQQQAHSRRWRLRRGHLQPDPRVPRQAHLAKRLLAVQRVLPLPVRFSFHPYPFSCPAHTLCHIHKVSNHSSQYTAASAPPSPSPPTGRTTTFSPAKRSRPSAPPAPLSSSSPPATRTSSLNSAPTPARHRKKPTSCSSPRCARSASGATPPISRS